MKKSTLIVVIVALALAAFVYFYDSKHAPKTTASEDTSKPAFSVKSDDISSVTIHSAGQTVSLSKNGTDWDLTQPVKTRADQTTVGGLVGEAGIGGDEQARGSRSES